MSEDKKKTKQTSEKEKSALEVAAEAAKKSKKEKKNIFSKIFKKKKKKAPELVEVKKEKKDYKKERAKKEADAWRRKKFTRFLIVIGVSCASFAVIFGIFSLFGKTTVNAGQAASVDDALIMEKDVTNYIKHNTYYSYYSKDQKQWGQMLNAYFGGAEKFREQAINDKFVHDELVKRACAEEGIEVSEDTINEHVDSLRSKYKNDDAFKKALEEKGETPETYRETVRQAQLEKDLKDKVCPEKTPTDEELVSYLDENKTTYKDAKRSSQILFSASDQEKAQQVLDQINAGKLDFAAAAKEYSTDEASKDKGGDVGWDKLNQFVTEYTNALKDLEVGKVSALVKSQYGYHIIKCTDKWATPDKITSLNGVPKEIVDDARNKKKDKDRDEAFKTYLDNFKVENGIKVSIYPMPNDVPYNVAPAPITSSSKSTAK